MGLALEKHFGSVENLGPLRPNLKLLYHISRLIKKITGKTYNIAQSYLLARQYAHQVEEKLKNKNFDVIIAPASSAALSYLNTDIPIIYYTDTTFKALYNYYEWFSGFIWFSVWEGNKIEKKALENSDIVVAASKWAENSIVNDYHIDKGKVHVMPMGANSDFIPDRKDVLPKVKGDVCKLLFLGKEWERKGGDICVETYIALKEMGVPVELTMVGCPLPEKFKDLGIIHIPFLDKNNPEEKKKYYDLLKDSHFLVVPTRAECFGSVYAEVAAYGMPSFANDTGGVSGSVKNGVNGYRLQPEDRGDKYATKIAEIYNNFEEKYIPLSISTRDRFEKELNWDAWAIDLKEIFKSYLESKKV